MFEMDRPSSQRELPVLLTIDVCDGAYDPAERKARFKSVMDILPDINGILKESVVRSKTGPLPSTWFVRSDSQVEEATSDAAGLVRGWSSFWEEVKKAGGEIGWHPHLYRREDRVWKPLRDPKQIAAEAEKIWREIVSAGWKPTSCRIGESVGCNELMAFLDSTGILVDATAVPGRKRDDGLRRFDWENTPSTPYYPAKSDYRRPAESRGSGDIASGETPLKILEVPFTTAGIIAPYDRFDASVKPIGRYVDLSYDPDLLKQGVSNFRKLNYLVVVVHPLQAIGREVPDGGLVTGGTDVLRDNIKMIIDGVERSGRTIKLLAMTEFREYWLARESREMLNVFQVDEKKTRKVKISKDKNVTRAVKVEGQKAVPKVRAGRPSVRGGIRSRTTDPRKRLG